VSHGRLWAETREADRRRRSATAGAFLMETSVINRSQMNIFKDRGPVNQSRKERRPEFGTGKKTSDILEYDLVRTKPRNRKAAVIFPFLLAGFSLVSFPQAVSLPRPVRNIQMTITVKGEYGLEGRSRATGRYALTFLWSGQIESDGDDYLLRHDRCELTKWEAEEQSNGPGGARILSTGDFEEQPELSVRYFLKTGDVVRVNFVIRGFAVPQSVPLEAFYLHLPVSEENNDREFGMNYKLFIASGSNSIILDDADIRKGLVEKTFHWTWRYRTVVQTNRHEADVKVVISAPQK
jgi:hypothetical protein